jgi:hypothetical protein
LRWPKPRGPVLVLPAAKNRNEREHPRDKKGITRIKTHVMPKLVAEKPKPQIIRELPRIYRASTARVPRVYRACTAQKPVKIAGFWLKFQP